MRNVTDSPRRQASEIRLYEIRVTGHLAARWADRLSGMSLTPMADGTTVIRGPVADQSALHGLLRTLGDLGLPLVCVHSTAGTDLPAQHHVQPPGCPNPRRSTT